MSNAIHVTCDAGAVHACAGQPKGQHQRLILAATILASSLVNGPSRFCRIFLLPTASQRLIQVDQIGP
jgi:hypothetical protein